MLWLILNQACSKALTLTLHALWYRGNVYKASESLQVALAFGVDKMDLKRTIKKSNLRN